jgi:hypothetical protein
MGIIRPISIWIIGKRGLKDLPKNWKFLPVNWIKHVSVCWPSSMSFENRHM